jgi:oligopeptide/dipeptide ABC transporter ATP-binding protein
MTSTSTSIPTNRSGPTGDGALLQLEDVSIQVQEGAGWTTLTENVNLSVGAGETVGLVGESGSGKTITGLAVLGVLPQGVQVGSGRILFEGTDLLTLPEQEVRRIRGGQIGMVFQEPRRSLDPSFSVGDQVAETIRAHQKVTRRQAWMKAIEMLERVQIPDPEIRAKQFPHQFSGGMCQRVMLAVALACQPKVLIADEPTTALDVTVQAAMLRLIKDLQDELDLGVLLITHDMGVVAEVCDSVAVMYAGQAVEVAPVRDIFHAPLHPYTAAIRDATPDVRDQNDLMRAIPGQVPSPHNWPRGCRFHPRCPYAVDECRAGPVVMERHGHSEVRCIRASSLELGGLGHAAG